jgi:hypothetical protein
VGVARVDGADPSTPVEWASAAIAAQLGRPEPPGPGTPFEAWVGDPHLADLADLAEGDERTRRVDVAGRATVLL